MPSKLESYLQDFDGVAVSILSEARIICRDMPGYFDDLLAFCTDPRPAMADGAAWMLKAEIEDGAVLTHEQTARLAQALDRVPSWQAKLALCQSIDGFQLADDQADRFVVWATALAGHPRPFLRAWALHVRVVLGLGFEQHRHAAHGALTTAEGDPAASVRARARQLRKRIEKLK